MKKNKKIIGIIKWQPNTIYQNKIVVFLVFKERVRFFQSLSSSNMSCPICDKDRWKELEREIRISEELYEKEQTANYLEFKIDQEKEKDDNIL